MKTLILSRYSRMGASSRLRLFQFVPLLEAAGIECSSNELTNDRYLENLFSGGSSGAWNLVAGYWRRLLCLIGARKYDLVIIEKELFPFLPAFGEWWLTVLGVPYVVDYDDAIFHNYDLHKMRVVRLMLGGKVKYVMRKADLVVCGNPYLARYAEDAGSARVAVIPTVIDTRKYFVGGRGSRPQVCIGWIGTPFTVKYLKTLKPVFEELQERFDVRLKIIGGRSGIGMEMEEVVEWEEALEAELIGTFDIGIMPLADSPWEQGKCGYKLIQYMGCALPVVASPVGVNKEIVEEGISGYLAATLPEWQEALTLLVSDGARRVRMGDRGRQIVEERYSLDRAGRMWIESIQSVKRKA